LSSTAARPPPDRCHPGDKSARLQRTRYGLKDLARTGARYSALRGSGVAADGQRCSGPGSCGIDHASDGGRPLRMITFLSRRAGPPIRTSPANPDISPMRNVALLQRRAHRPARRRGSSASGATVTAANWMAIQRPARPATRAAPGATPASPPAVSLRHRRFIAAKPWAPTRFVPAVVPPTGSDRVKTAGALFGRRARLVLRSGIFKQFERLFSAGRTVLRFE